jgi:hypothetical protein
LEIARETWSSRERADLELPGRVGVNGKERIQTPGGDDFGAGNRKVIFVDNFTL